MPLIHKQEYIRSCEKVRSGATPTYCVNHVAEEEVVADFAVLKRRVLHERHDTHPEQQHRVEDGIGAPQPEDLHQRNTATQRTTVTHAYLSNRSNRICGV